MDHTEASRRYYDTLGAKFGDDKKGSYWNYTREHLARDVGLFLGGLNGNRILDLGSGAGRDALLFRELGFNPICADISRAMAKACVGNGIPSCVMDIENLGFKEQSFDGVWAYTSLLHFPKRNLPIVLNSISKVLGERGLLFLGMKEGDYDGYTHVHNDWEIPRYVARYRDNELRGLLGRDFDILHFSQVKPDGENVYLNYLCKSSIK